ncbi:MAG: BMP family ABC transporter substrate-binding protein [Tissierellia bacterium]|nr:BMP family ABC transporter substrate-binding protein [Tissierellia bacterium]
MKTKKSLIAILLVMAMTLVACGGGNNAKTNNNASADTSEDGLKVGFVTDEGGVNDQSFNQGVDEGLNKAKDELGVDYSYVESHDPNDYSPNMETLLDQEKDLIVGAGFKMGETILTTAENNPDIKFGIVDVDVTVDPDGEEVEAPDNIVGIMFRAQEPSFLVGYIAGLTTETNKVGFVGGQEGNIIWGFDYGYRAGVDYAAKEKGEDIAVEVQYVGNFSDAQKGKSIATTMYQQGCDVVFHAAGGAGDGVIEAAKEQGKWVIGVDKDQYEVAPENVLTSAMKNADVAVYDLVKATLEGNFEGGKTIELGLSDDGAVGIAPTSDKNVAQEILDKIPEIEEKIINGEIKVPYNQETYNEYQN